MEVTRRRGRRRKKLLDDIKDRGGYSHLKKEALDRTIWRNRFGGGFGPVVRQYTEWMMNLHMKMKEYFYSLQTARSCRYLKFWKRCCWRFNSSGGIALCLCASDSRCFQGWHFLTDAFHKTRIFNLQVTSLLTGIEENGRKEFTIFSSSNFFRWLVIFYNFPIGQSLFNIFFFFNIWSMVHCYEHSSEASNLFLAKY